MKGNAAIGLEIHTYLITKEKLFCTCLASRERGLHPNTRICPICTGQPGAKPMAPNQHAVERAVMIALMLGCVVNSPLHWMRKHYSWPDLPKGYQTTMSGAHAIPLGTDGNFGNIHVTSMHLEEDPASWDPSSGFIDYNRSGLPLVEIVTAPDFKTADEVVRWLEQLVHALSYLKIVDSNAGIKVDVNVNYMGKTERVEVKNINSLENVHRAILYELERQAKEGSIRETRRFDERTGKTISMRTKENQDDYRFINDPDLLPVIVAPALISKLEKELPELPEVKLKRLIRTYSISEKDAHALSHHLDIVDFFELIAAEIKPSVALHWVLGELIRVLNWNKTSLGKVEINPTHFIALLKLMTSGTITELQAKQLLNQFVPRSFMPEVRAERITSEKELEPYVKTVISKEKKAVADYRSGDEKALNFLMGEVMKVTERRADFKLAKSLIEKLIN